MHPSSPSRRTVRSSSGTNLAKETDLRCQIALNLGVSTGRSSNRHWLPLNRTWDDGPATFLREFRALPPGVGHLYAGHWCQSEVCNGGLEQFFHNTTGLLAPEALAAFHAIGIPSWADVLLEAMSFFGHSYPRERLKRMTQLAKDQRPFRELDKRFYAWLEGDYDRWARTADEYAKRLNLVGDDNGTGGSP